MKVLFFAGSGPCRHDYGLAFLYDGLCSVLGHKNVWDMPVNPTFHLEKPEDRDDCNLDSDLCWPKNRAILEGSPDLVIVGVPEEHLTPVFQNPRLRDVPFVFVDVSDQVADMRVLYERATGRTAPYFKRELPMGASWGKPLPMCYPASRIPSPMPVKEPRIYYHATDHGGGSPGIPRREIVRRLRDALPDDQLDVALYPGQAKGTRPSPEEYHAAMAQCLVGISWNGAVNYDCNRTWEQFALGLAQVIERPRIKFPRGTELIDGVHCYFADTPEDVARLATMLVKAPEHAMQVARRGHAWFLRHHSSEARVRYLLEEIGCAQS